MGLTSALNTALNGLSLNETSIDVLGNNIANAGTNGFKASNVLFTTQLARTLSVGSRPTAESGGSNPQQIGLGATTAAIAKDFSQGSVTNSTSPSDLAIQGDGFFILDGPEGDVYSRNGNFSLNSASLLTNADGLRVQGYGVDNDFNVITTQLVDISVPLGDLNVAQQTQNVTINGALLPTGDLGANGTLTTGEVLTDTVTTNPALAGALLVNLQNAGGTNLFTNGETLSFTGRKGGRSLEAQTLTVTGTTTYAELATLIDNTIGIHSGGTVPNDGNTGGQPGVGIVGGALRVVGNSGTVNEIVLAVGDLTSNGVTVPVTFTPTQAAVGESAITDYVIFDSLGQPVTMKMTAVLESRNTSSTTFRYFLESSDDSDADTAVSTGIVTFDSTGQVIGGGTATFSVDRNNTAAVSPMQIALDLSNISGISSDNAGSTLSLDDQDGSSPGTLTSFVIDETGTINGVFDNGIVRTLGQIQGPAVRLCDRRRRQTDRIGSKR